MSRQTLQDRADALRNGEFLGVPLDEFERGGREQLILLLTNGLTPQSKVLDIGCGVLRAGYWLIHFLDRGGYCGIEPSPSRLAVGTNVIIERDVLQDKQPRFDHNERFDTSVFDERFDYFLAYSIWTHASKRQIQVMLDGFCRDTNDNAVFLTTFLPAGWRHKDYAGDAWVGTSHESQTVGCIHHRYDWIRNECLARGITVDILGRDTMHGQTWLRIARQGRPLNASFLLPSLSSLMRDRLQVIRGKWQRIRKEM